MPILIESPARVEAAGNKPKIIEEFIGRVNSGDQAVSVARMRSPEGWVEPAQTPEFDEFTIVLKGRLRVRCGDDEMDVLAGQAVIARKGERVQYSTPDTEGAEYVAVCVPAFSIDLVKREEE